MKKRTLSGLTALALSLSIVSGFPQELFWNISDSSSVMTVNAEETEPAVNEPEPGETETQAAEAETQPTINETEPAETEAAVNETAPVEYEAASGNIVETGQCGDNVFYELDSEGTLTISGSGDMYDNSSLTPFSSNKNIKSVFINEGITSIGRYAFYECKRLTDVYLPSSIRAINGRAFYDCIWLKNISLPEGLVTLDDNAFENCRSLTTLSLPKSLKKIGTDVFKGCSFDVLSIYDTDIDLWEDYSSFAGCKTKKVILNDGAEIIPASVIRGINPQIVVLPDSITKIDDNDFYHFSGGSNLTEIIMPSNIVSIGSWAFTYCKNLSSITIPESVTSIGDYAFYGCSSLTSITIPNSVTFIGDWAFEWCSSLTNITISNSVTTIRQSAFEYCKSLTSVKIPNSVTSIDNYAFYGCKGLTSVTIPDSITSIGIEVFGSCDNLTIYGYTDSYAETYADENNIPFIALDGSGTPDTPTLENFKIVQNYDDPTGETYKIISYEGTDENVVIPAACADGNITAIHQFAFSGKTVKSVTISENITDIDNSAFSTASALESISVNENNTSFKAEDGILYNYDMTKLICYPAGKDGTEFTVPESVTAIENLAFNDVALKKITIGKNVTEMKTYSFSGSHITIYGYTGSYAETFAKENNIPFRADPETCEHTYSTKYSSDAADHWHVCTICGAEQLGSRSPHTFSTKYTSDAGYHWHVCTICGTEQLGSRTRHSFGDFAVTKEPTETEAGSKEAECKYCGYIKIEEIPKLAGTIYVNEGETYSTTSADARKSFVVNGGKLICSSGKEVIVNSGEALSIINSKIDSVIINGGKFTSSGKINGDVLVTGKSGFLNTQIGGTYVACDGTEIGGNLTIEKNGVFEMNGGNVKVYNNFTFASQYEQKTSLLSGSLWIGGDFTQKNQPFKPYRDSYTVIFYGNSRKTVTYKNVVIPNLWITPEADDGTNLNQVFKIKNVPNGIFRCNSEGTKTVANRNKYIIDYSWQKELVDNMDKLYDSYAQLTNDNFGVLDGITIDNKYKKEINRQVMAWYAIISSDYAKDTKKFSGIQFKKVPVKVNRHSYDATITFGFVDFMKGINNSPYLPTNPVTGGINFNGIHYIIEVDDIHKTSSGTYSLAASTDQTKFAKAVVNTINNGVKSDIESIFKKLGLSVFEISQMTSNHFIEAIFQIYDSYKIVEGEVNKYKSFVGKFTPIYIAKYQIDQHCPVDTYVYNENGVLIASIVNNEVVMDNDDVVIWTDGESKFIRFNNDKYTVKTIGNDSGTMDCEIRQYNDNYELVKRDMYDALAVSDGKIYVSGINIDENLVLMEENSGVNIPIEPDEEYFPERHNYQDTWNWNSTSHWHECACGDKTDIAQHISNGGIVTVQPTAYTTGVRTYSCTVCGYVIGSEIIPTTGNYVPSVNVLPYASIFPTATVTHPALKATAETKNDTVTLRWNKINNAKKYTVYQLINGKYVKVKDTNTTTVTLKKLKNGNTYKFIVRYTVNGKESSNAYSGRISVTLRYKPVVKAAATQNSVRLVWNDIPNSQKYAVYKYVNGKAVKLIETKKTSVKINKLTSKTEYQYIVCAYVNGKWTTMTKSDIVTVKTE